MPSELPQVGSSEIIRYERARALPLVTARVVSAYELAWLTGLTGQVRLTGRWFWGLCR